MAKRSNKSESILEIANTWKQNCLIKDQSVFTTNSLWSLESLNELRSFLVGKEITGDDRFYNKFRIQLENSSPKIKQLAAEVIYMLLLFSSNITPERKKKDVSSIWLTSGEDLNQYIKDFDLWFPDGYGSTGIGYNNYRWEELIYFTNWILAFKTMNTEDRNVLITNPWKFGNWLEKIEGSKKRQGRHIFLFLLFPDFYETSSTIKQKNLFLNTFQNKLDPLDPFFEAIEETDEDLVKIDKQLLSIRKKLMIEADGEPVDYYKPPYRELWDPDEEFSIRDDESESGNNQVRYWVEKCNVKGIPERLSGPDSLGKALWSPQVASDGSKRYQSMTEVKRGDIILHLTDNEAITGVSVASGPADNKFIGLKETAWADKHCYRIPLKNFVTLEPLLHRDDFLCDKFKKELLNIKQENKGLFYDKGLDINQGFYLTEAPIELVILLNTIYQEKNGKSLPHIDISNQSRKEAGLSKMTYSEKNALDDIFMDEKELNLILATLKRKKNIIIQGPPGVGKTFISKRLAYLLIGKKDITRIGFTQFHQSYSYEDFMQGWRPTEGGGFKLQNGPFYEMCKQAEKFPDHDYIFVIDEINRGNLSKIFGELMMLIESDKRGKVNEITLIYSQGPEDKFFVPSNLYLIGLMNTADRSLAMVDYALRRRFGFLNLTPQFESIKFENTITSAGGSKALVSDIRSKITELNQFIRQDKDLGPGFQIGHSYFCPQKKITDENEWYQSILNTEIKPLLDEYWFLDPAIVDKRMGMLQR